MYGIWQGVCNYRCKGKRRNRRIYALLWKVIRAVVWESKGHRPALGHLAMSVESAFSVCLRGELRVDLTFCDVEPNTPLFPTGVHYVFDTTIAADFSILESQKEFVRRFRQHNEEEPALPMLTSACPGEHGAAAGAAGAWCTFSRQSESGGRPGQWVRSGAAGLGEEFGPWVVLCWPTYLLILGDLVGRPDSWVLIAYLHLCIFLRQTYHMLKENKSLFKVWCVSHIQTIIGNMVNTHGSFTSLNRNYIIKNITLH